MDALSYQDFTLKACVSDTIAIEKRLTEIGTTFIGIDSQKDTYFETENGKLKWRQGNIENLITHYQRIDEGGLEKTIVYRYDLNPTQEQIAQLYHNHRQIGTVEKVRKIFYAGGAKVHLDVRDGQTFIEIEAIDRSGIQLAEALRRHCLAIKEKLGIPDNDLIKTGYF